MIKRENERAVGVYRLRLYPTSGQEAELARAFEYRRFVYNNVLAIAEECYQLGQPYLGKFTMNGLIKHLRRLYPFLKNGSSNSYQHAIKDLDESFQKLFTKQGGRPKFRSRKKHKPTVTYSQGVEIKDGKLSVEKITDIPINLDKQIAFLARARCGGNVH